MLMFWKLGMNQKKRILALTQAASRSITDKCATISETGLRGSPVTETSADEPAVLATPATTMENLTPTAIEEPWNILNNGELHKEHSPACAERPSQSTHLSWEEPPIATNMMHCVRPVLHRAADNGNARICQLLLDRGASIETLDFLGKTALHVAVENGNEEIVQAMLQHRDSNVTDTWGRTALFAAVENKDVLLVKMLVKFNINVNLQDCKGETPLHIAVESGCDTIVQLLLENGADPLV